MLTRISTGAPFKPIYHCAPTLPQRVLPAASCQHTRHYPDPQTPDTYAPHYSDPVTQVDDVNTALSHPAETHVTLHPGISQTLKLTPDPISRPLRMFQTAWHPQTPRTPPPLRWSRPYSAPCPPPGRVESGRRRVASHVSHVVRGLRLFGLSHLHSARRGITFDAVSRGRGGG